MHITLPKVSVIIPTRNRATLLRLCLRSVLKQKYRPLEIIVIDNGSTDDTFEVTLSFSKNLNKKRHYEGGVNLRYLYVDVGNLSQLFNLGLVLSTGQYVLYLNDDAILSHEYWINIAVNELIKNRRVAAISGPIIDLRPRFIMRLIIRLKRRSLFKGLIVLINKTLFKGKLFDVGYFLPWGAFSIGQYLPYYSKNIKNLIEVDHLSITATMFKKDIILKLGGFDNRLKYSHADGDLFIRLKGRGYKMIFHPFLKTFHIPGRSGATRVPEVLMRDSALFLLKNFRERIMTRITLLLIIAFWIIYLLTIERRPKLILNVIAGLNEGLRKYKEYYTDHKDIS